METPFQTGKRQIETVTNIIKEKVAKSLDIPLIDIESSDRSSQPISVRVSSYLI